jgi:hypothetical protein
MVTENLRNELFSKINSEKSIDNFFVQKRKIAQPSTNAPSIGNPL